MSGILASIADVLVAQPRSLLVVHGDFHAINHGVILEGFTPGKLLCPLKGVN